MPNGGSDCCGTCWFNSKNEGEPGYHGSRKEGIVFCTIRELEIPDPFYTYCANHPYYNRKKIDCPLGPVYDESNKIWVNSPDSEKIRMKLLELLDKITYEPEFFRIEEFHPFYHSYTNFAEEVIIQIIALKEERAIPGLKRIIEDNDPKNFLINNSIVTLAKDAWRVIINEEFIPDSRF